VLRENSYLVARFLVARFLVARFLVARVPYTSWIPDDVHQYTQRAKWNFVISYL